MSNFIITGSHPALSAEEIISYFKLESDKDKAFSLGEGFFIFETNQLKDPVQAIRELGGAVKIGIMSKVESRKSSGQEGKSKVEIFEGILEKISDMIKAEKFSGGKFNFGISIYGTDKINLKNLGMAIKSKLKEEGRSCRWVVSRDKNLSSVVVDTNHLLDKGMEIVILKDRDNIYLGKTLAVQPFRELSFRDYGRPARDDLSGMLPPKLAQIMINLAQCPKEGKILDPFCGSGTILTEAMLMGYLDIHGSDISQKAVEDTKKNVEWTRQKAEGRIKKAEVEMRKIDIFEIGKFFKPGSIDAVVAETYLGPQRGRIDIGGEVKKLGDFYSNALDNIAQILKPGARAVMAFPVFNERGKNTFLNIRIPHALRVYKSVFASGKGQIPRTGLLYGRPGQRVWREIAVFRKLEK